MKEQIIEINKERENSPDEDGQAWSSLMGLFKRAKKQEEDNWNLNVFVPKLKTVKKKTFMRSIAPNKF